MIDEQKPAGTRAGRRPLAADAGPQPAAGAARELLIRELGAILAGWGVTDQDDELLAPLADSVAGLLAAGPDGDA